MARRRFVLRPRGPLDFASVLAFHGRHAGEIVDRVEGAGLARVLVVDGAPVLVKADEAPVEVEARVRVSFETDADPAVARAAAASWARRAFHLDADLAGFHAVGRRDAALRPHLARWRGYRPPLAASLWEAAVWAVLSQQISVAAAYGAKRRFVERYGPVALFAGVPRRGFPPPERLADEDAARVKALGLTTTKARALVAIARALARDPVRFAGLDRLGDGEAITALTDLHGVGRWTAEYVLLAGAGHPDVFPAADLGLRDAAAYLWGLGARATETELRRLAQPFAGRRSLLAGFLWNAYWFRDRAPPSASGERATRGRSSRGGATRPSPGARAQKRD